MDMASTVAHPEAGAAIRPGTMVTAPPARLVRDDDLKEFAAGSGLNGPFLADQFSAFLAHERMGVDLLRTLHARTNNPALLSRYSDVEGETLRAVESWERLIQKLGGNPQYVSPAARMVEALDEKTVESLALSGSADPLTFEQAGVQAFLNAADQCATNVALLAAFADAAEAGPARQAMVDAAETLRPMAAAHREWAVGALEKMVVIQAKHPLAQKVGQVAEKVVGAVRNAVTPGPG
jgi:hypothetical protein